MSFADKLNKASAKAGSAISKEYKKQKQKVADKKEEKRLKIQAEEDRKKSISLGNIAPISTTVRLLEGEVAYLKLTANKWAIVDEQSSTTVGKSKKKGVVGRAVVGGVLLGPLGALGGAATAGSKTNSVTTTSTVSVNQIIDKGPIIFTNQRIIFIGNQLTSISYKDILATGFERNKASFKYPGMLNGEYYELSGVDSVNVPLYFEGINKINLGQANKLTS